MGFLNLFDESAEIEGYRQALAESAGLRAGIIVAGLLGLVVGVMVLTNQPGAAAAGLTWSVLTLALGLMIRQRGFPQHAKNRMVMGAVVGLLSYTLLYH